MLRALVFRFIWVFVLLGAQAGCSAGRPGVQEGCGPPGEHSVFVVRHAWHTGIAFSSETLPDGPWRQWAESPGARWVEVGWGDADYYPARPPAVSAAFRAVFPGPSVLHRVFLAAAPPQAFAGEDMALLHLSDAAFRRLLAQLDSAFYRDAAGRLTDRGPGLYGDARFFSAHGRFSLLHNCNGWTAEVLRAAGCQLPSAFLTAGALMYAVHGLEGKSNALERTER